MRHDSRSKNSLESLGNTLGYQFYCTQLVLDIPPPRSQNHWSYQTQRAKKLLRLPYAVHICHKLYYARGFLFSFFLGIIVCVCVCADLAPDQRPLFLSRSNSSSRFIMRTEGPVSVPVERGEERGEGGGGGLFQATDADVNRRSR